MTTALLTLLVLIELARLVLQYKQGKAYREQTGKTYCATKQVENVVKVVRRDYYAINECIEKMSTENYELVAAHRTRNWSMMLFFTRKKIKNFIE